MEHNSDLIIYNTDDGKTHLQVTLENETVWLTQKQMAELFQKTVPTINEHFLGSDFAKSTRRIEFLGKSNIESSRIGIISVILIK